MILVTHYFFTRAVWNQSNCFHPAKSSFFQSNFWLWLQNISTNVVDDTATCYLLDWLSSFYFKPLKENQLKEYFQRELYSLLKLDFYYLIFELYCTDFFGKRRRKLSIRWQKLSLICRLLVSVFNSSSYWKWRSSSIV